MSQSLHAAAAGRGGAARFRDTILYDAVARLPVILWFVVCANAMTRHLLADLAPAAQGLSAGIALQALARVAGLGFVVFVIAALTVRLPPVARTAGWLPRVVAVGGTFSVTALVLLPSGHMPLAVAGISAALMILGNGYACYAVLHLGRSLSIMAEARRLVTSGPYAWVRHPLYAAEATASLGLLLQFLSPLAIALWALHVTLQLRRMRYEEEILRRTFPEYSSYAQRTARVLPGIY